VIPLLDRREFDDLRSGARAIGIELNENEARALLRYLDRFYSWNRYGGFTSIPRGDAVRLHLLDSIALATDLMGARSIVDLGTGGGMPGVPLALVLHGSAFTLVESRGRRCTFLREVIRENDLAGRVEVLEMDAWKLAEEEKRFDAVVARAFLPPQRLLLLASRIVGPAGRVIVMSSNEDWIKDDRAIDLLTEVGLELRSERTFVLPAGDEIRRVFRFQRCGS
jgi:16S rRNA (guanine527-N7)-methyltransferase